ncbi:MAG: hypothetical protein II670_07525, partial [Alphaproteobacteria bacterium]|nr:hypothetical protein [Alphaproteobacteria bacterium]
MYSLRHWKGLIASIVALVTLAISIAMANYLSADGTKIKKQNFDVLRIGVIDSIRLKTEAKCFRAHDEIAQRIFDLMVKIREISSQMTNQTMQIRQDKQLRQKQKQSKFTEMDKKWKILSTDYSKAMRKEKELDAKLTDYIQNKVLQVISDIAKKFKIDIVINKGSQNMTQVFYNTS